VLKKFPTLTEGYSPMSPLTARMVAILTITPLDIPAKLKITKVVER